LRKSDTGARALIFFEG